MAGILAQELIETRLKAHGYQQSRFIPGLWTHKWRPICFSLVVDGTDTIDFIAKSEVPPDRWKDVTYASIVCNYRAEKDDPNWVRITVEGNKINYTGECGTPTADLLTIKLLFNSVILTPGAKFMTMDISNFYLKTPLKRKEYLKMKLSDMPEDII